jgi:hypothetical protein
MGYQALPALWLLAWLGKPGFPFLLAPLLTVVGPFFPQACRSAELPGYWNHLPEPGAWESVVQQIQT